jgi:hypothetical protein
MERLPSPLVRKHWNLFVQMQALVERPMTRHAAAVKVAKENWSVVSRSFKSYGSFLWWLQYNYRKYPDEARESLRETEEQQEFENSQFHAWFKKAPKQALKAVFEEMFEEKLREFKRDSSPGSS